MNDKINCTISFQNPAPESELSESDQRPATIADVFAIVKQLLSATNIYVLESDITNAQNNTQTTIKQTYF